MPIEIVADTLFEEVSRIYGDLSLEQEVIMRVIAVRIVIKNLCFITAVSKMNLITNKINTQLSFSFVSQLASSHFTSLTVLYVQRLTIVGVCLTWQATNTAWRCGGI